MSDNKTITYTRLVEAIYRDLIDEDLSRNILEDEEFNTEYNRFHKKYIDPEYSKSFDEGVEMYEALNELIFNRAEKAFKMGFESARILLMKGANEDVL